MSGASLAALVAATDADLNAAMQGILSITMMAQGRIKTVAEAGVSCDMN